MRNDITVKRGYIGCGGHGGKWFQKGEAASCKSHFSPNETSLPSLTSSYHYADSLIFQYYLLSIHKTATNWARRFFNISLHFERNDEDVNFGCVSLGKSENGSLIQDRLDQGASQNPLWKRILRCTSLCHSAYITFCIHYSLHNYASRMSGVKGSKLLHKTQNFPNVCILLTSWVWDRFLFFCLDF